MVYDVTVQTDSQEVTQILEFEIFCLCFSQIPKIIIHMLDWTVTTLILILSSQVFHQVKSLKISV